MDIDPDECEHGVPLSADCIECIKRHHADELRALETSLAEVEAERDRLLDEGDVPPSTAVAWCPDCGEVETCDEDGACSCGRDIVVFDGRGSFEALLEYLDEVAVRQALETLPTWVPPMEDE